MTEFDLATKDISTNVRVEDVKGLIKRSGFKAFGLLVNSISLFNESKAANVAIHRFSKVSNKKFTPRGVFANAQTERLSVGASHVTLYRFGHGPKVLLCHGWSGQASDFYKIIDPLVSQGFQVIAFDGPAHGKSPGSHTHLFEFVDVIEELAKQEGNIRFAIGHSMGAAAIVIANDRSRHFSPGKLITVGAPNALRSIFEEYAMICGFNSRTKQALFREVEKLSRQSLDQMSLADMLNGQNFKAMLVHDRTDNIISFTKAEEILERAQVSTKLVQTVGLGHIKVLRDPSVISQMLNFIAS